MIGSSSGGPVRVGRVSGSVVRGLIPVPLRRIARPGRFGAIVARESRFWWRDPRRRASLVSILMASAVVPIALNVVSGPAVVGAAAALPFSFAVSMSGTIGGMMLANQFAFDGNAYATHLLTQVPGRIELRARALAVAVVALPVQVLVVVAVSVLTGRTAQVPAGFGMLCAAFGAAIAAAGLVSVLAPYALPDNANPFALNNGGASAKGMLALVAMVATLVLSLPVILAAYWFSGSTTGACIVLLFGVVYGLAAARSAPTPRASCWTAAARRYWWRSRRGGECRVLFRGNRGSDPCNRRGWAVSEATTSDMLERRQRGRQHRTPCGQGPRGRLPLRRPSPWAGQGLETLLGPGHPHRRAT